MAGTLVNVTNLDRVDVNSLHACETLTSDRCRVSQNPSTVS